MLSSTRQKYILEKLNSFKSVSVKVLSEELEVSKPTIRNDFDKLCSQNPNIERTHGGLILNQDNSDTPIHEYDKRSISNKAQKKKIAFEAVKLLKDKMTILIDSSSTSFEFAKELTKKNIRLTVLTNGLNTALLLKEHSNLTVVLIGGFVSPNSNTTYDDFGTTIFSFFNIDLFFFSASSVSFESGFTDYNLNESRTKKNNIELSRKSVALIDSSKFDNLSNSSFASLSRVDLLITDNEISDSNYSLYSKEIDITISNS